MQPKFYVFTIWLQNTKNEKRKIEKYNTIIPAEPQPQERDNYENSKTNTREKFKTYTTQRILKEPGEANTQKNLKIKTHETIIKNKKY